MQLTRKLEQGMWLPVSIERLDGFLESAVKNHLRYPNARGLRRNLAYSLQHVEYLEQTLCDLKLTSVMVTQTWKTIVVVGCGIVESLLHYFLTVNGYHATTDWELQFTSSGNPKEVNGAQVRIESSVYKKLDMPANIQMSFESMLKRAERKNVMGNDHQIYAKMNALRPLRNRVHIQLMRNAYDTDWAAFNAKDHKLMIQVLYAIFFSKLFLPTVEQRKYFDYMHQYAP